MIGKGFPISIKVCGLALLILFLSWETRAATPDSLQTIEGQQCSKLLLQSLDVFSYIPGPITGEEARLVAEGIIPSFVTGMDLALRYRQFVHEVRKSRHKIDPRRTHIEFFASLIEEYIEFVRKGILLTENRLLRKLSLIRLKFIEAQATKRKLRKEVTFYWWVHFNYKLTKIASLPDKRSWKGLNKAFEMIVVRRPIRRFTDEAFPSAMLLPFNSKMGLETTNAMSRQQAFLLEVSGQRIARFDHEDYPSAYLYGHDLTHGEANIFQFLGGRSFNVGSIRIKIFEKSQSLAPRERALFSGMDYLFSHDVLFKSREEGSILFRGADEVIKRDVLRIEEYENPSAHPKGNFARRLYLRILYMTIRDIMQEIALPDELTSEMFKELVATGVKIYTDLLREVNDSIMQEINSAEDFIVHARDFGEFWATANMKRFNEFAPTPEEVSSLQEVYILKR